MGSADVAAPFLQNWSKMQPGNRRTYADLIPSMHDTLLANMKNFFEADCFPEKCILSDGSPLSVCMELFALVCVSKNYDVVEV